MYEFSKKQYHIESNKTLIDFIGYFLVKYKNKYYLVAGNENGSNRD